MWTKNIILVLMLMMLTVVPVNAETNTSIDETMFQKDITTPNVLLFFLLILVSGVLIYTQKFGLIIAGGLILVLVSTMIMYSFNSYIGLMLLLATIAIMFEVSPKT